MEKKLSNKDTLPQREKPNRPELIVAALAAMRRLGSEIDRLDHRAANHFGISRTDLHVIDNLRSAGPMTPSQLARSVSLSSGGLSIALERLERIGYIRRYQHPDDRRSILVEATEAVAPLEADVFDALIERMKALLDSYTNDQLATITHYLTQAATTISQAGPAAPGANRSPATPTAGREPPGARHPRKDGLPD